MEKELYNHLNISEKDKKILNFVQDAVASAELTAAHRAQNCDFGISHISSQATLRARETQIFSGAREQYGLVGAEVVLPADQSWQPVLEWVAGHPYALKTGDRQRIEKRQKRARIDIEQQLLNELEAEEEDFVGPHRYATEQSMATQVAVLASEGINCQVLVHRVAEHLNKALPRTDRSRELFIGEQYRRIDLGSEALPIGAVLFFHERPAIKDPAALHLAVYVGSDFAGVPWILHATSQVEKTRPATDVVPLTNLFMGRQQYFYGAVELPSTKTGE